MAKQTINTSNRSADSIKVAFEKVNANFTELYGELSSIELGEVTWESVTGKPNIPTDLSQLTDNQGLLADSFDGGSAASEYNEDETLDGGGA
jgi:hypothetical protein